MRQTLAVALALAAASLGGCFTAAPEAGAGRREPSPFTGPTGDDVVRLDVYLVERPAGDAYLTRGVWEFTDEQTLQSACKARLEDNGFRAGRVGGLPDELRRLTESERSCADPRRLLLHAGRPAAVVLGPPAARQAFRLVLDGRAEDVAWDQAQCLLEATPRLADGGRVTLRLTPQVRHGAPVCIPRPSQGPDGLLRWDFQAQQESETYKTLAWELTLAPDEYAVVGAAPDRDETLGACAFLGGDDGPPRQRLLVLRVSRAAPPSPPAKPAPADDGPAGRSPPLALQAAGAAGRGAAP
jgi:hypothetical protein